MVEEKEKTEKIAVKQIASQETSVKGFLSKVLSHGRSGANATPKSKVTRQSCEGLPHRRRILTKAPKRRGKTSEHYVKARKLIFWEAYLYLRGVNLQINMLPSKIHLGHRKKKKPPPKKRVAAMEKEKASIGIFMKRDFL